MIRDGTFPVSLRAVLLGLVLFSACVTTPASPPEPPLPPGQMIVVQRGQTVTQIARETGSTIDEIVEINGLRSADDIRVGQLLFVPAVSSLPKPPLAKPIPSKPTPSTTLLAWPVEGLVLRDFAGPKAKNGAYDGVLIAAPAGTAVHAAAAGRVAFVGSQDTALGLFVILEHEGDLVTLYAHLRSAKVKVGAVVGVGDVVGVVGTSGLVGVSPRVQFQVRRTQVAIDPLPLLPP